MLLCSNARIFMPEGWVYGGFRVENGLFSELIPGLTSGGRDLGGAKVIPGLVDIHIHGAAGADASDGDSEGLLTMGRYLASRGVTAFLPTLMSLPEEEAGRALAAVREAKSRLDSSSALILGARMEGPFLSEERRGAQNRAYLRVPDAEMFARLNGSGGAPVRIIDLAPELRGALAFIRSASRRCRVSLGHTAADYETAASAFGAGASHVTHLFNAMSPFRHREPGLIGAAAERENVTAELICDGLHIHPSAVRLAFRLFPERLCLVSDAMRCCGLAEGVYDLGGQSVTVRGGEARLADGTLAGSAADLFTDLTNAVRFGADEETAIRAATALPARVAGCADLAGSIGAGRRADYLVCGDDLSLREVYISGKRIR